MTACAARCRRCLLPLWEPSNILRGVCAGCWDAGMEVRLLWAAGGALVGAAVAWWLLR